MQIAFTVCSYTESLYALLSFGGVYHLMSGANNFAILCLALSGFARSNGVLNAGYIGFQTMHRAYDAIFRKKHLIVSSYYFNCCSSYRSLSVFSFFVMDTFLDIHEPIMHHL